MMVIAIAASVGLTGAGCATRSGNGMVIGVGGLVATLGVAVVASDDGPTDSDQGSLEIFTVPTGTLLILAGVAVASGGFLGLMHTRDDRGEVDVEMAVAAPDVDGRLDRLALRAIDAARASECAEVRATVDTIRSIDGDYYRITLAGDPLIVACLAR